MEESSNLPYAEPDPTGSAPYFPIRKFGCSMATSQEVAMENVKLHKDLPFLYFHQLPGHGKFKGIDNTIYLVGGGPSLKDNLEGIRNKVPIVACGSVHDFLIANKIIPTYCVLADPDPIMANYVIDAHPGVTYIVATHCDPKVFTTLKNMDIVLWHCFSDGLSKVINIGGEQAYGGGCTVGLRALSLFVSAGWQNFKFYGFDSSYSEDGDHHSYKFVDEINENIGDTFCVKMGMGAPGEKIIEKVYKCAGYQMAQVDHFKNFMETYGNFCKFEFVGTGLLPDYVNMIMKESDRLNNQDKELTNVNGL